MFKLISLLFLPIVLSAPSGEVQNSTVSTYRIPDIIRGEASYAFTGPARPDYQYTPGIGAHKLHTRGANFNDARKICEEEGGHLAIVNSYDEERILLDLFKRAGKFINTRYVNEAWIGMHDLFAEGDWVTITGQSFYKLGYQKWYDDWNAPHDRDHTLNCVNFVRWGGLNDANCDINFGFFCEIPDN